MQRSALCRSRRELSNEYLLAKFAFDTAPRTSLARFARSPRAQIPQVRVGRPSVGMRDGRRLADPVRVGESDDLVVFRLVPLRRLRRPVRGHGAAGARLEVDPRERLLVTGLDLQRRLAVGW